VQQNLVCFPKLVCRLAVYRVPLGDSVRSVTLLEYLGHVGSDLNTMVTLMEDNVERIVKITFLVLT